MSAPVKCHTATFWAVFDAELYGRANPTVSKVRARRITQKRPDLSGGEIALKFSVAIPDAAFLRLIPDIEISVPEGFWTSQPITVHVADPEDEEQT